MKNIVIAAGYATRLYPLTQNFPKPLLKIGKRTILDRMLDDLDHIQDIDSHIIVSNHKFAPIFQEWAKKRMEEGERRKPITIIDDGTSTNETRLGAVRDLLLAINTIENTQQSMVNAQRSIVNNKWPDDSGGGAKGAAEIGVLKYIEEAGVHIDYIVGTSIGSIIGGLYSVGYRSQQLDSLFVNTDWENIFSESIAGTQQISNVFSDLLNLPDSVDFDSLPIPYRCVATDIINTEEVILQRGNLARAMRASMSIPGAFKPVKWEGKLLVDGGMLNNLPVDIAKKMGADIIIAIDLAQRKHENRDFSLKEEYGIGGVLDWLISRPDWKKHNENRQLADIYINPNLKDYDAASFSRDDIRQMILIGEEAGKKALKELRKLATSH